MATQQVMAIPITDEGRAIATITMAFSNDPVVRWVFRDAARYDVLAAVREGVRGRRVRERHSGFHRRLRRRRPLAPTGVEAYEETIGAILMEAVPEGEQEEVFALLEQMGEFHPTERHWYEFPTRVRHDRCAMPYLPQAGQSFARPSSCTR